MKKIKEFLLMLISFIILSAFSAVWFIVNTPSNGFLGGVQYLKMLITDPFYLIALVNTYIPSVVISVIFTTVFVLLTRKKKQAIGRRKYYLFLFVVSLVAPIIYIIVVTKAFNFVNNTIYTLKIGIIVTFLYWIFENITEKIKKRKL